MIGLAVTELIETLEAMRKLAARKKLHKLSEELFEMRLLKENMNQLVDARIDGLKTLVNDTLFSKVKLSLRLGPSIDSMLLTPHLHCDSTLPGLDCSASCSLPSFSLSLARASFS
jgi:hypothetical protein